MSVNPSTSALSSTACEVPIGPAGLGRTLAFGTVAALAMLAIYLSVLTLVSGWSFALSQFRLFWFYILPLAFGFGAQVGLYVHLRRLALHSHHARNVVAVSGTTSTAAMISCCAHYLANVLPIIGAAGIVTVIAQYQVQLFWLGLIFNAGGIAYVALQILRVRSAVTGRRA